MPNNNLEVLQGPLDKQNVSIFGRTFQVEEGQIPNRTKADRSKSIFLSELQRLLVG